MSFGAYFALVVIITCVLFSRVVESRESKRFLLDNLRSSECRNNQADILFLLDMSSKVGQQNFDLEKQFVRRAVDHIYLGHEHFQIAVGTYSTYFYPEIDFHNSVTKTVLENKIDSLRYFPGQRSINIALHGARAALIAWTSGERAFAAKILFLITAGPSTATYANEIQIASQLRNSNNITIFVIGVTPEAKSLNVTRMTADDKHFFYVDDFQKLMTLPDMLLATVCHDVILHNHCFDRITVCHILTCTGLIRDLQCPKTCGSCTASSAGTFTQAASNTWTSTRNHWKGSGHELDSTSTSIRQTSHHHTPPQTQQHHHSATTTTPRLSTTEPQTHTAGKVSTGHKEALSPLTSSTSTPKPTKDLVQSSSTTERSEWITVPLGSVKT